MDKVLKILIIASWYKDENNPIAGSFIEEQAQLLHKKGHQVSVLHPYLKGTFLGTIRNRSSEIVVKDDGGIKTIKVGVSPFIPKLRFLSYKKLIKECVNHFESIDCFDYDLIHSHAMFMGGVVALGLSRKWEVPYFHTEHSSGFIFNQKQYTKKDKIHIKKVVKGSSQSFFVSKYALEGFKNWCGVNDNVSVLHNLVSIDFFNSDLGLEIEEGLKLSMICSLTPRKNVELAIRAMSFFKSKNVQLTIYGNGKLKEKLEMLITSLSLQDIVKVKSALSRDQVFNVLRESHVLLSTSRAETFGLTVAEAQALGKPVVVTDSGGVRDIVEDETGIVCKNNAEELAKAIEFVRSNYSSFSPTFIRAKTKEKFGQEEIYSKLMKHYNEALNLTS